MDQALFRATLSEPKSFEARPRQGARKQIDHDFLKRFFQSEIGAAVVWVICTLVLAAVISPWVYQGGQHLAVMAKSGSLPKVLELLGEACGRSQFPRFFDRSLMFSALVLLPPLLRRLRKLRAASGMGQVNPDRWFTWKSSVAQIAIGCVIAGSLMWGLGMIVEKLGAFTASDSPHAWSKALPGILLSAAVASVLEEWLFRGILLGMWLRSSQARRACLGVSLLFAFLHFLKPPAGRVIENPGNVFAGFELLGNILLHFTNPLFLVTDFATLFGAGLILAWARVRTGALWFCIGLHAGWILAFKSYQKFYDNVPGHPLTPWGVGENLRSGLLPLCTLGVTALVCHFALRRFPAGNVVSRASR